MVKPTTEKRSAEVFDGIVAYPDANGVECFAAFGAHQVRKSASQTRIRVQPRMTPCHVHTSACLTRTSVSPRPLVASSDCCSADGGLFARSHSRRPAACTRAYLSSSRGSACGRHAVSRRWLPARASTLFVPPGCMLIDFAVGPVLRAIVSPLDSAATQTVLSTTVTFFAVALTKSRSSQLVWLMWVLQLEEGVGKLAEQDEVEVEVTLNRRTGARRARAIRLVDRAGARRELGQVRALRVCAPTRITALVQA